MKTLRHLGLDPILQHIGALIFLAVLLNSCTEQPSITNGLSSTQFPKGYIIPSTMDTFNAGLIHNHELYYIYTHYDTVKYASYPNKLSIAGVDSLAALFISDSLQNPSGPLTSSQISEAEGSFDSTYNLYLTTIPTHVQLVGAVDSLKVHGLLASDEANFIINADTDIRLCSSNAQIGDTVTSLMSQYNATTWQSSPSQGWEAYEYLSIANHSCNFWGQAGDTIPVHPPESADAAEFERAYDACELTKAIYGRTDDDCTIMAEQAAIAASSAGTTNPGNGSGHGSNWKDIGIAAGIVAVLELYVFLVLI